MFSSSSNSTEPKNTYDSNLEENTAKCRGLFLNALQRVQQQVHPSLTANDDALRYIEDLILRLLSMLCASQPHSVQDVEEKVTKTFPHPIDKWAITDAQNAMDKGKKKSSLVLPIDKIQPVLVKDLLGYKVETQVTIYIVAVLEYIAADILKLTGNYVKNIKHLEITRQDIKVAMCADKVLMDMFFQEDDVSLTSVEDEPPLARRSSLTYEDIIKDLVLEETQYMRDLNMIIKVFRDPFEKLFPGSKDLDVIFGNILEIQEFTAKFISSLEDCLEMAEEGSQPLVGPIFEEMVEGAEFDVYDRYTEDITNPSSKERFETLLKRNDTLLTLQSAGHGFKDAVKYVLPKLLLGPIYHSFHYFDVIKVLIDATDDGEEKESLEQALGVLQQVRVRIDDKLAKSRFKKKSGELSLRFQGRGERQAALTKMQELIKCVDGWEGKDTVNSCNKFIMEGTLFKQTSRRERYVFLFDSMIILTKLNTKRSSVTGPVGDYKLKEKCHMRHVEMVNDREDTDDLKYPFELQFRGHPSILFGAKCQEDKNNWMAALVSLLTKSMLERMLDANLMEEEKKQPLRLPSPDIYGFSLVDSERNIVFEENHNNAVVESPLIKGGTLIKLVERLTYHMYADPKFVRTFLTTYRSFCKPDDLLDLLMLRFNIPDPPMPPSDAEEDNLRSRDDLKRFRNEYVKPVQIRVLNVIRHWVDQHWYDFELNRDLLGRLRGFLDTVKGKAMKKYVESIDKTIQRRLESANMERQITYEKEPPKIEWHITKKPEEFDLMTLHPIEIARQVTLLEFDLYRAVKPSELVGSVWIKKQKNLTSPNLLKMIHHSTMFTFWLEKCIVEAENFDERVMVTSRVMEIMLVFQELNNFNGVLEVVSALNSAPVYRLKHTFEEIEHKFHKLKKVFDEANELNSDHFRIYIEKLRSINPPCVPFLGMYLTNILHTEEGNPDFLPHRPEGIINFSKRRKVAEITQEIQQYQNQPYCLTVENEIRTFFENLNPLGEMTDKEFSDYLYNKSLEIEPRNCKAPTKGERTRDFSLKSPGVKPMSSRGVSTLRSERNHPTLTAPSTPQLPHHLETSGTSSCEATPPTTPSSPRSPHMDHIDTVFATVFISTCGSIMQSPSTPLSTLPPSAMVMSSSGATGPVSPHHPHLPPPLTAIPNFFHHPGQASPVSTVAPATPLSPSPVSPGPPIMQPFSSKHAADRPPPLPPRRKKDMTLQSSAELSPVRQCPEAPLLPPRDNFVLPSGAPPLPPRRGESMTLPRRNSDRDQTPVNINGDRGGSVTPELPPKTYPGAHSRKKSS